MKTRRAVLCTVTILFLIGSLLMITNSATNHDSPLYGDEVTLKLIWTESEMRMFAQINGTYDGTIITDEHTHSRPFSTYLHNEKSVPFKILPDGSVDTELFSSGLIIWRQDGLTRPVHVRDGWYVSLFLLDDQFRNYLDNNYSCISVANGARSYLPNGQNITA